MRIAKLAIFAAAGAVASGGIALASTTGSAPSMPGRVLPTNAASQAQQHAAAALAAHPSGPAKSDAPDKTHPAAQGHPNPNLNGLCHAWLAGAGAEHGNARSNPAFSVLVAAAGGSDAVDGYCTTLVGAKTHPAGDDSDEPSDTDSNEPAPAHPDKSDHPGRTSHPQGRPSDLPPIPSHAHPSH